MANMRNTSGKVSKSMNLTVNHEGATVHQMNDLEILFSQVLGSFFGESAFYETKNAPSEFTKLYERINSIPDSDKEYVLKVAEIGRMCNMIDYPLNILSAVYNTDKFLGKNFMGENGKNKVWLYADKIILRAKDIVTLMNTQKVMFNKNSKYYIDVPNKKGKSIPMQLRKTLRSKIQMYDKFKLSKGLSKNSDISLADCISLLRPKPRNKEYAEFYKLIQEGKVLIGDGKAQIKTELTKKGQTKKTDNVELSKAVVSDNLMNIIKNLMTLYKNGVFNDNEILDKVCAKIQDPKEIKQSRLLPFRFYSAYKEMSKLGNNLIVSKLKDALVDALDLSVENVEKLEGVTAILIDKSGSMECSVSDNSALYAVELAAVLGAIAFKSGVCDLFVFSNECKKVAMTRRAPVIDIVNMILDDKFVRTAGTNLKEALSEIKSAGTKYDSLILLSDNDCYGYDKKSNSLTFQERSWRSVSESADSHINSMIKSGVIKKVWLNNLLGNEFVVANTNDPTKNLVTGFSEKFLSLISIYNQVGTGKDIRKVIDQYYNKLKGGGALKES
jgi:hypothetical protein